MKIALDFDDTYTKDPELWTRLAADAIRDGHEVTIVTSRCGDDLDNVDIHTSDIVSALEVPVLYCHQKPKRYLCQTAYNKDFDIWIDDMLESVIH